MKTLLEGGFESLTIKICSYLDIVSLHQCRAVCTIWRDLIDNNRQIWIDLITQLALGLKEESTKHVFVIPDFHLGVFEDSITKEIKCKSCHYVIRGQTIFR